MFRIYYGDGSVYDGDPNVAPRLNVQCIVCDDDNSHMYAVGHRVLHQWDYYLMSDTGRWYGCNGEADLVDHVLHCKPSVVLKGRMIEGATYQAILKRASVDKKNWGRGECGHPERA